MAETFEFKNVDVTFSTMLNRIEKAKNGRIFIVKVPMDSPELARVQESYKKLNDKAKESFNQQLLARGENKKCKNADMSVFDESEYNEGFVELKFQVASVNEREVEDENGNTTKKLVEAYNPFYKENFSYKLDANGKKQYQTDSGKKWYPASTNVIDLVMSLTARYNAKDNKVKIVFVPEDVCIVKSDIKGGGGSSKALKPVTLDSDDEVATKEVAKAKPVEDTELVGLDI